MCNYRPEISNALNERAEMPYGYWGSGRMSFIRLFQLSEFRLSICQKNDVSELVLTLSFPCLNFSDLSGSFCGRRRQQIRVV